jgi:chemotaxis protein CheX
VFLKVYEKMLGEKHDKITEEIEDAAGEILNMIYGHAKTILKEREIPLEKALPSVMRGENIKIVCNTVSPTIELVFGSEIGEFHMELSLLFNNTGAANV